MVRALYKLSYAHVGVKYVCEVSDESLLIGHCLIQPFFFFDNKLSILYPINS